MTTFSFLTNSIGLCLCFSTKLKSSKITLISSLDMLYLGAHFSWKVLKLRLGFEDSFIRSSTSRFWYLKVTQIFASSALKKAPSNQINNEQKAILNHMIKNGLFCGDSSDMDWLVDNDLAEFAGRKSFVPDGYYRITAKGKGALAT